MNEETIDPTKDFVFMKFSRAAGISPRLDLPLIHFRIQGRVVTFRKNECLICWMRNAVRITRTKADELHLRYVEKLEESGQELRKSSLGSPGTVDDTQGES